MKFDAKVHLLFNISKNEKVKMVLSYQIKGKNILVDEKVSIKRYEVFA